ncbi:DUF4826 family protein [Alteromonas antoniana]|uniref:DUF4826 family protein n=1 Tax=Alteromonas antoniana TaxID=2803813 RepID=UPI001C483D08|nr:DUF4826 family protein [Alteromonas antoniana]
MTEQTQQPMTQEQREEWVKAQFQRANKHLAENGVLFHSVVTEESRYLVPFVAVWKLKALDEKFYWVMSGDLPADYTLYENASNAREAIKYFSMQWQLKAENIRQSGTQDKTQLEFAGLLQARAENLFNMQAAEQLWKD